MGATSAQRSLFFDVFSDAMCSSDMLSKSIVRAVVLICMVHPCGYPWDVVGALWDVVFAGVWTSSWGLQVFFLGGMVGAADSHSRKLWSCSVPVCCGWGFFLLLFFTITTIDLQQTLLSLLRTGSTESYKFWTILAGHRCVNQRCVSLKMLPGMSREVWRWESSGELGGFASNSPALPLPVETLFPHEIMDCVCVREFRKLLLSLGLEKKKGARGISEIIALVENSWRAVWGGFVFVFFFFF